jgi:molybdate transport system permease protein
VIATTIATARAAVDRGSGSVEIGRPALARDEVATRDERTRPDRRASARPDHPMVATGLVALVWLLAAALILFLILPLGALVERTGQEVSGFDGTTRTTLRQALTLSLVTSTAALGLTILLGTPLAYLLARRRFRGRRLVDTLVDLPIVLPPAVAGLALLMAFGRRGLVGEQLNAWGLGVAFSTEAVILAQLFVASPFYVRAAKAGFARVARDVEESAADLGAPPFAVFRTVTLPLVRPSLAAGAVLAWARALGEFGATIMFAGSFAGRTQTMPLAIYGRYEAGDLGTALLLSLVLVAASLAILLAVRLIGGRAVDTVADSRF